MSHKHRQLIRAIFREPIGGNIHWREVESLLHHLGAAVEPRSGARVRVRLNGVEDVLHRPHPGFLDVHHVLGAAKSDRVYSHVALCPNCHREAHFAANRDEINAALLDFASRFRVRPEPRKKAASRYA